MKKAAIFLLILLAGTALWAQHRYALVIGNADYPQADARLPNTINDTTDIRAALTELGYSVELKQNLDRRDMIREITAFIARLRSNRNSEGFFWYAGHAIEINGENYLMPLDVTVDEGDEMIRETSYSVTRLTSQLDEVRNKVNVVVLDACRVPPGSGGGRGYGGASRVIRTVSNLPPDLMIIYSTASGAVASDGTGRRNSPFTEAFLKHIRSTEPLVLMIPLVTNETLSLTQQMQRPYHSGSITQDAHYSLNPASERPSPVPERRTYNIGDRGPAGGIIFYDKQSFSDGWRYLEAAPAETEIRNLRWGSYGLDVSGTLMDLGSGKQNTQLIIGFLRANNESGRAAQICAQLNSGGVTDWFLPSREELHWMYLNLHNKGLGGFKNSRYWSSSQVDSKKAWYLHFGENGRASNNYDKDRDYGLLAGEIWTRAIRSF